MEYYGIMKIICSKTFVAGKEVLKTFAISVLIIIAFTLFLKPSDSASKVTRINLADKMQCVLNRLAKNDISVQVSKNDSCPRFSDLTTSNQSTLREVLEYSLMAGFPDNSFRPQEPVRFSEMICFWSRFCKFLLNNVRKGSTNHLTFSVLPKELEKHWSAPDIDVLIGMRVIENISLKDFLSDAIAEYSTLNDISRRTLSFFMKKETLDQQINALVDDGNIRKDDDSSKITKSKIASFSHEIAVEKRKDVIPLQQRNGGAYSLEGQIFDSLSKKPLSNANLTVNGELLSSDGKGKFAFKGLKRDEIVEIFSVADGYQSLSMKYKFRDNKKLKIYLKPFRSCLKIQAISSLDGKPVDAIIASLESKTYIGDKTGNINIKPVKPGYYQIHFSASGYLPSKQLIYVDEVASKKIVKLHPQL